MARGKPSTNLADDINKLVKPAPSNNKLAQREARAPIEQEKGSGKSSESSSGGGAGEAVSVTGSLESADGLFVVAYEYHYHAGSI
jgi:hypothetical protein